MLLYWRSGWSLQRYEEHRNLGGEEREKRETRESRTRGGNKWIEKN